jgi:hypothetical protein
MRGQSIILAVLLVAFTPGCVGGFAPVIPPPGGLFTDVKMPITTDFHETSTNCREAEASTFFLKEPWFGAFSVSWGDASMQRIARDAGFHKVHYADAELITFLPFFARSTVKVCGE